MTKVYIVNYENPAVFSTARKAIEDAIGNGYGVYDVFVSHNFNTDKTVEFPLSNVKRAISQLNDEGFITFWLGQDSLTISQNTVR